MARRRGGFFGSPDPEDTLAREREVEALLAPRRSVVQDIPIERIAPNPFQARKQFEELEELADAIRQQGFTSRLRVRPEPNRPGYFQLVYGERRLRAAKLAGLAMVPCEVAEHSDEEMVEIGLAENIQRRDLTPLEEAEAFRLFIEHHGYSIRRLAERIGKHKNYVDDRLALLRVPTDVRQMVAARPDTLRAAREIAKLPTAAERAPLIEAISSGGLNVHDVRTIVKQATQTPVEPAAPPKAANPPEPGSSPRLPDVQRRLERDVRTCRTILGRWQELLAVLDAAGQKTMQTAITELLDELERLQGELREPSNRA